MKQKKSVEDYLKIIYILSKEKEVHGVDIAGELKVSRPTVSVALKALAADACQMEHAVSRESYEALKNLATETMGGK